MKLLAFGFFALVSSAVAEDVSDRLVDAAYHDDLVAVRALVTAGAKPDAPNALGANALAMACMNGNAAMLGYLLESGAAAQSRSSGEPVLVTAARAGHPDCVDILLKSGADPKSAGNRKQSALMWAAAGGHGDVVALLLAKGAVVSEQLDSGFDSLMFAVRGGHTAVVKQLAGAGGSVTTARTVVKPNGKSMRPGTSPLILAIENGHFELASELLALGADPNDQRSGLTPLHALSWTRKAERGDGPEGTPTPQGSGNMGSLAFARRLIEAGADVNLRLNEGSGGPANLVNKGATPFLLASKSCDLDYLKLLLEHGANPRIHNEVDTSPLLTAAGIGVFAPGEEQALEEDSLEVIEFLLGLGLDINHVDKRGDTVMHAAAYKSSPAVIKLLDQRGADIRVWHKENRNGWTPLLIAQGFRPGNFRPIQYTEDALTEVMRRQGVEPTPSPPPPGLDKP
jgi:ankyrin repeat protein